MADEHDRAYWRVARRSPTSPTARRCRHRRVRGHSQVGVLRCATLDHLRRELSATSPPPGGFSAPPASIEASLFEAMLHGEAMMRVDHAVAAADAGRGRGCRADRRVTAAGAGLRGGRHRSGWTIWAQPCATRKSHGRLSGVGTALLLAMRRRSAVSGPTPISMARGAVLFDQRLQSPSAELDARRGGEEHPWPRCRISADRDQLHAGAMDHRRPQR